MHWSTQASGGVSFRRALGPCELKALLKDGAIFLTWREGLLAAFHCHSLELEHGFDLQTV